MKEKTKELYSEPSFTKHSWMPVLLKLQAKRIWSFSKMLFDGLLKLPGLLLLGLLMSVILLTLTIVKFVILLVDSSVNLKKLILNERD